MLSRLSLSLHVHSDERWPMEVTSNTYFRWPTGLTSNTYFRGVDTGDLNLGEVCAAHIMTTELGLYLFRRDLFRQSFGGGQDLNGSFILENVSLQQQKQQWDSYNMAVSKCSFCKSWICLGLPSLACYVQLLSGETWFTASRELPEMRKGLPEFYPRFLSTEKQMEIYQHVAEPTFLTPYCFLLSRISIYISLAIPISVCVNTCFLLAALVILPHSFGANTLFLYISLACCTPFYMFTCFLLAALVILPHSFGANTLFLYISLACCTPFYMFTCFLLAALVILPHSFGVNTLFLYISLACCTPFYMFTCFLLAALIIRPFRSGLILYFSIYLWLAVPLSICLPVS